MHLWPFLVPAYSRADPFLQTFHCCLHQLHYRNWWEERGAKLLITFAARKWITVCLPLIQFPGSKKGCCTKSRKRMRLARMQPDPHWHLTCCFFERLSCMFIWQVFGQVDHSHRPQLISVWKGQKNLHPPDILAILAGHIWWVWGNRLWKNEVIRWFTPSMQSYCLSFIWTLIRWHFTKFGISRTYPCLWYKLLFWLCMVRNMSPVP